MRAAALALALAAGPAAAQTLAALDPVVGLIAEADGGDRSAGAMAACLQHVLGGIDPEPFYLRAGWTLSDGYEGERVAVAGDTWTAFRSDGSFCMVETTALGSRTLQLFATGLLGAADLRAIPLAGVGPSGCPELGLGADVSILVTGEGQDPACTSDTGAAFRIFRGAP